MLLSDAPGRASFKVIKVNLDKEVGKRLADMGFIEGSDGAVIRESLFGGLLQVRIIGYDVLIRRFEALVSRSSRWAIGPLLTMHGGASAAGRSGRSTRCRRTPIYPFGTFPLHHSHRIHVPCKGSFSVENFAAFFKAHLVVNGDKLRPDAVKQIEPVFDVTADIQGSAYVFLLQRGKDFGKRRQGEFLKVLAGNHIP